MRLQRRTLGLGIFGVLLAILLLGWAAREPGPRYQGRGVSYWFPRLGNNPLQAEPWQKLGEAGEEVMPLLVGAANLREGRLTRLYQRLQGRMPPPIQRLFPSLQSAESVQREVAQILVATPVSPEFCRALTNAFDHFPPFVQEQAIRWSAQANTQEEIVVPQLLRAMRSTNDALVLAAAETLLTLPGARVHELSNIFANLDARPLSVWTNGWSPETLTVHLSLLGTNGAAAIPWVNRWLTSSLPALRASATLTLPALAPERFPFVTTFLRELPTFGPAEIAWAIHPRWISVAQPRLPWPEFLGALAPLLDPTSATNARVPGMPAALSFHAHQRLQLALLGTLDAIGSEAAPAAPYLPALLTVPDAPKPGKLAANLLAKIGPVAPGTIPRLLPGLTNADTAPPLVLLLAAYGPQAKIAVPVLTRLARGELEASPSIANRAMPEVLRRYGSRPLPASLRASTSLPVWPELAYLTGLTNFWPLPPDLRDRSNLTWIPPGRSAQVTVLDEDAPGSSNGFAGSRLVPPVALSDLAAEALRHIGN